MIGRSYTKLTAFKEDTKDAETCIKLKPDWSKGYTRKGHVEFFTKQFDKALETYQLGLSKGTQSGLSQIMDDCLDIQD